jgi:hypothetical protein
VCACIVFSFCLLAEHDDGATEAYQSSTGSLREAAAVDGEVAVGLQGVRAASGSGSSSGGVDYCGGPVLSSAGGAPWYDLTTTSSVDSAQGKGQD